MRDFPCKSISAPLPLSSSSTRHPSPPLHLFALHLPPPLHSQQPWPTSTLEDSDSSSLSASSSASSVRDAMPSSLPSQNHRPLLSQQQHQTLCQCSHIPPSTILATPMALLLLLLPRDTPITSSRISPTQSCRSLHHLRLRIPQPMVPILRRRTSRLQVFTRPCLPQWSSLLLCRRLHQYQQCPLQVKASFRHHQPTLQHPRSSRPHPFLLDRTPMTQRRRLDIQVLPQPLDMTATQHQRIMVKDQSHLEDLRHPKHSTKPFQGQVDNDTPLISSRNKCIFSKISSSER